MTVTLFGLKNCDTCKKALKTLAGSGVSVDFVDIREEADLVAKLPLWLSFVDAKFLLNTRSTTWRALSDSDKARAEGETLAGLLTDHPTLIKRPVIEAGGQIYVGWNKEIELSISEA